MKQIETPNKLILKESKKIEIVTSFMAAEMESDVCFMLKDLFDEYGLMNTEMQNVSQAMKVKLESSYGQVWHVLINTGSLDLTYSYQLNCSIQLKCNKYLCTIWQTPIHKIVQK